MKIRPKSASAFAIYIICFIFIFATGIAIVDVFYRKSLLSLFLVFFYLLGYKLMSRDIKSTYITLDDSVLTISRRYSRSQTNKEIRLNRIDINDILAIGTLDDFDQSTHSSTVPKSLRKPSLLQIKAKEGNINFDIRWYNTKDLRTLLQKIAQMNPDIKIMNYLRMTLLDL